MPIEMPSLSEKTTEELRKKGCEGPTITAISALAQDGSPGDELEFLFFDSELELVYVDPDDLPSMEPETVYTINKDTGKRVYKIYVAKPSPECHAVSANYRLFDDDPAQSVYSWSTILKDWVIKRGRAWVDC